ncbi:hypothetical protein RP20_CCG018088 [Aedes albopictus]|nr:hypothetical protein RP20_CCG018088 [Aedes albopictus]
MSKPTVYTHYLSPPSRAVDLCATALGIELELLIDGGAIINDSHAIMIYLVSKYGKNDSLYPKDLAKMAKVNAALCFNCGVLFARLRFVTEPILLGGSDIPAEKAAYMDTAYQLLEDTLTDSHIAGSSLTIADFSCGATVSTAMGLIPMDEQKYPKIYAWLDRLKTLPYFEEVNGRGAVELPKIIQTIMETNGTKN